MPEETPPLSRMIEPETFENYMKPLVTRECVNVAIHDLEGTLLAASRVRPALNATFDLLETKKNFRLSIRYAGLKASEESTFHTLKCGVLSYIAKAIYLDEVFVGTMIMGPFLSEDTQIDQEGIDQFAMGYQLSIKKIKQIFRSAPTISEESLPELSELMHGFVEHYLKEMHTKGQMASEINVLNEAMSKCTLEKDHVIEAFKTLGSKASLNAYPYAFEKEFVTLIHLKQRHQAIEMLNAILDEIFSLSKDNLDLIKAKLFELYAFFIRAAVRSGVTLKKMEASLKKTAVILNSQTNYEEAAILVSEFVKELFDLIEAHYPNKQSNAHLLRAIDYIHKHYHERLTLSDIAQTVAVSDYYLSHLFRSEMDITFVDYVNKVRLNAAKKSLQKQDAPISEIARISGFTDPNYFSKTFKKSMGITPSKYAKLFKGHHDRKRKGGDHNGE